MLVRPAPDGELTVLMGRRSRRAAFIPDMFVFPGGRADPSDDRVDVVEPLPLLEASRLHRAGGADARMAKRLASAAVRETWEETGYLIGATAHVGGDEIRADHSALRFAARAITPRESPIRFHARFFIADGTALTHDPAGSGELSDLAWFPLSEAQKLPVIDVTEFMLAHLKLFHEGTPRVPFFAYRGGKPATRWATVA